MKAMAKSISVPLLCDFAKWGNLAGLGPPSVATGTAGFLKFFPSGGLKKHHFLVFNLPILGDVYEGNVGTLQLLSCFSAAQRRKNVLKHDSSIIYQCDQKVRGLNSAGASFLFKKREKTTKTKRKKKDRKTPVLDLVGHHRTTLPCQLFLQVWSFGGVRHRA